ncbi:MAG: DEAD/DEAH box helicase [Prolixibacteraceae bacterium]|jgi:ATP-dependent RNA helicase DeaD|nr:DEAD/DEAH box helicase [Prolixibacteraceae bacterium]MBT6999251.1 DEAD/DEAH box helicase [Prolixibacteraceae bacterium]MBT7393266.1 DEAD/DEAH box helicase [Prolixibacteraceae bacterium]
MTLFNEMGLSTEIQSAIEDLGFEQPTPIQEKVVPFLLENKQDMVALAQTGTGKTAAFGLPIIQQIDTDKKSIQTLILSPTRELAMQIASDLKNYAKNTSKLRIAVVYGGSDIKTQINDLARGPQIVVGTPGRTLDLIKRKRLRVEEIEWLVLDEADEMLSMGFKDDLDAILENSPKEKQTLLFSATMPREIVSISKRYMTDPFEISAGRKNMGAENVEHHYYLVHAKDRYLALKRVADINPNIYGIIFCRTRAETKDIADKLMQDGYNADALHGDLSQAQRDHVMARFRGKHLQMLVATDVAARGLDVNDLTHVINYNLPDDPEIYIHRSGRTGRAGKKGISVTLIHLREKGKLRLVEKKINKSFNLKQVPSGIEICEKQMLNFIDKVEKIEVKDEQIAQFMPVIYKKLAWLEREELIKHFVSVAFNRFLKYYENAPDINVDETRYNDRDSRRGDRDGGRRRGRDDRGRGERDRDRSGRSGRGERRDPGRPDRNEGGRSGYEFSRFFFNLGKKNGIGKRTIIDLINQNLPNKNVEIGNIEVLKSFSFFEVDKRYENELLKAFKNATYKGQRIGIDVAKGK